MSIDLQAFGITNEELVNRIVDKISKDMMTSISFDEDDGEYRSKSDIAKKLDALIKQTVDEKVASLAEKHVLPNVNTYIENLTLQATNKWGEKTGQKMTFIEYLTKQAENYLVEPVNYEGKSKEECGSYSFTKSQTRITHMIDKHLHYSIETAMKNALASANSAITEGITETVKIKLTEIVSKIKTEVKIR
jgi:hypothetical protein